RQYIIGQTNQTLEELQERLSGLTQKELRSKDVQETDEHRLKIVKGMSNRELDTHLFEVLRTYDFLSDYLDKLSSEKEKRIKYGLIPIDGIDWEPASNGRPSIGPRIDITEVFEEETGYV
ncbi:MAG: hypothetical protein ACRD8Z_02380, partial [Nitrososphaeraceae archaeon]